MLIKEFRLGLVCNAEPIDRGGANDSQDVIDWRVQWRDDYLWNDPIPDDSLEHLYGEKIA
jgi:hypothetical protein